MSKAARIRELYAQGLSTGEIAAAVGCSPEYVRVAGRQRRDGKSVAQFTYEAAHPDYAVMRKRRWMEQYRTDAVFRSRHLARCRARRAAMNKISVGARQKPQQPPAG